MENRGKARHATDDDIIQRMHIAWWMTKATDTHSEYLIFIALHGYNDFADAPKYYVYMYVACFVFYVYF